MLPTTSHLIKGKQHPTHPHNPLDLSCRLELAQYRADDMPVRYLQTKIHDNMKSSKLFNISVMMIYASLFAPKTPRSANSDEPHAPHLSSVYFQTLGTTGSR